KVGCVAFALDKLHSIQDPAICPACKTPYLVTLPVTRSCSDPCDDGNPCTLDACDDAGGCRHVPGTDGAACDDGDACTTDDACHAGLCVGTPVVCGADTPCTLSAVCVADSGQCVDTAPFSTCVAGGGDGTTDCAAEWVVDNRSNPKGRTANVQVCKQGD